ncbi:MAG: potassium channel family protein [Turicibacter sp.]
MKKITIYEWVMMILALVVVVITVLQLTIKLPNDVELWFHLIDTLIWLFFLVDYFVRLSLSQSKWKFIKEHKLDLLTIVPFHSFFRIFRLVRVAEVMKLSSFAKVLRATVMLSTFSKKMGSFIKTNNFNYVLAGTTIIVLLGAGGISITENINFGDALWWSIVTVATVGYGDIAPITAWGRLIASIVMLSGIGFLGVLTGTISTYFLNKKRKETSYTTKIIDEISEKLSQFDELSIDELTELTAILMVIKKGQVDMEERKREKHAKGSETISK